MSGYNFAYLSIVFCVALEQKLNNCIFESYYQDKEKAQKPHGYWVFIGCGGPQVAVFELLIPRSLLKMAA